MTLDASTPPVNTRRALTDRERAGFELAKVSVALRLMPDAQFAAELDKAVHTVLFPLYERDLLTQEEIRAELMKAAGTRRACIDALDALVPEPRVIQPKAYAFRAPEKIRPRPKIMGDDYTRGYVSATVAPGGVGKSALVTAEILALITGRRILGRKPRTPKRVWYVGEDDQDELDRRFAAAMKYYGITRDMVGDRLFVESFRDNPILVAAQHAGGTVVQIGDVRALISAIRRAKVDVIVIDPLVKTHRAPENDNGAMEVVYNTWSDIAHKARCAVHLVVHTRKAVAGQAKSIEDVRGASSQLGAVRSARLIVRMEADEAASFNLDADEARLHIRVGDTKANMAPPAARDQWMRLNSVTLNNRCDDPNADNDNPDDVQVVDMFKPPAVFDGVPWDALHRFMREVEQQPRRLNMQAKEAWAGHLLGELLDIDTDDKRGRTRIKRMLDAWLKSGALRIVHKADEARRERPCVTVGEWDFSQPSIARP